MDENRLANQGLDPPRGAKRTELSLKMSAAPRRASSSARIDHPVVPRRLTRMLNDAPPLLQFLRDYTDQMILAMIGLVGSVVLEVVFAFVTRSRP